MTKIRICRLLPVVAEIEIEGSAETVSARLKDMIENGTCSALDHVDWAAATTLALCIRPWHLDEIQTVDFFRQKSTEAITNA